MEAPSVLDAALERDAVRLPAEEIDGRGAFAEETRQSSFATRRHARGLLDGAMRPVNGKRRR